MKETLGCDFNTKYSDFIKQTYAELKDPRQVGEWAAFLMKLGDERRGINRPRINVMRIKQVRKLPEHNTEEVKEKRIQESLTILKDFVNNASEDQEEFDDQYEKVK